MLLQSFGSYDIANISVPVLAIRGTEDTLVGGQEEQFFSQLLPNVQNMSQLLTFNATTGGALHDQVGSVFTQSDRTYAFLNSILG